MEGAVGRGGCIALWERYEPSHSTATLCLLRRLRQISAEQTLLAIARLEGLEQKLQQALLRGNRGDVALHAET